MRAIHSFLLLVEFRHRRQHENSTGNAASPREHSLLRKKETGSSCEHIHDLKVCRLLGVTGARSLPNSHRSRTEPIEAPTIQACDVHVFIQTILPKIDRTWDCRVNSTVFIRLSTHSLDICANITAASIKLIGISFVAGPPKNKKRTPINHD